MLCDGGSYAFSNLDVPTGLTERSRVMLELVCARRICRSQANHAAAARLSALACGLEGSTKSQDSGVVPRINERLERVFGLCVFKEKEDQPARPAFRSLMSGSEAKKDGGTSLQCYDSQSASAHPPFVVLEASGGRFSTRGGPFVRTHLFRCRILVP